MSDRFAHASEWLRTGWNHALFWADTTRYWAVGCVKKVSHSMGVHAGSIALNTAEMSLL